jgi:hypothetical protein
MKKELTETRYLLENEIPADVPEAPPMFPGSLARPARSAAT